MLRRLAPIALAVAVFFPPGMASAQSRPSAVTLAEPSVSPDHSEIAFLSGGDVWSVPAAGGTARLLADVGGTALRPLFSPDGKRLAFVSTRTGDVGVHVLDLANGTLLRVTHDDVVPTLDAWSADGKDLYFSTIARAVSGEAVIRRVPASGGTPVDARAETYVNQMDAMPSPDGSTLAYVRNGFGQWWRRGHAHIDEGTIVLERGAASGKPTFESATDGNAKDLWPMWSPDGSTLYYVSDRTGEDQLWERRNGSARALTKLGPGRIVWPTISRDGRTIAFERDMAIWTFDTASGQAHRVEIGLRGFAASVPPSRRTLTTGFAAFDLAPDGKKVAFVARGTVFAANADTGGEALPATMREVAVGDEPVWAKDSRRVAYVRDDGDTQAIATYAFPDGPQKIVTPPGHHDDYPHWSPDGTKLEYVRDGTEIHVIEASGTGDRVVARGTFDRRPFGDEDNVAFSPDGAWLAFVDNPPGGFANAFVVPLSGGPARAVTALPNTNTGPLAWAPDGKRLYVVTSQRTEDGAVAQVDLTPQAPRFGEDTFRGLFEEAPVKPAPEATPATTPTGSPVPAASASPAPVKRAKKPAPIAIDFNGIERRISFLPTGLDVGRISVSPDSKKLVLDATAAGQQNLYAFSVDETSDDPKVANQLTSTSMPKARARISPDGKSVVYLDGGRFFRVGLDGKDSTRPIAVAASLDVDFERDKRIVFAQAWTTLDRWYADPHFNGVDWAAQRKVYEAHALAAHTREEFELVMNLMIGELDSSHSGFREPRQPGVVPVPIGNLGVDFDPAAYARDGSLRIATVVPQGPLALTGRVKAGDVVLAIDGAPVDKNTDIAALLENTVGKRTEVRLAEGGDRGSIKTVPVLPVDVRADSDLRYHAWVEGRRAYVDRISGGKLGYVHLVDMEPDALRQFFTDLDVANREKRGVVIDVRNNDGGFVDPYALDVLARHEYLRFKSRFGNDSPARTQLGQRALDLPTVLVTNEQTLSDGEDFTEGYRRLRLGKVVGVPTAGWIIFTSSATLADGSQVRVPSTSVFTEDGVNMERHPRPVDVYADTTPAASERGDDLQLDAAVRTLLR